MAAYDRFTPDFYGGVAVTWGYVKKLASGRLDLSAPVVLLSDSTGGVLARRLDGRGIQNLAMKIWDGMPAQYFLLKRYLEAGARPRVCFFMSDLRVWDIEMDTDLDYAKAADSFMRPLGSWGNAWDLLWSARRPDLAWVMLKEWALPTRRFKIPLGGILAKLRVYPAELVEKDPFADEAGNLRNFDLWKKKMARLEKDEASRETLGEHYFLKMKALCRRYGIKLVVFQCPIYPERKKEVFLYDRRVARIREFLKREQIAFYEQEFIYDKSSFDSVGSHVQAEPERTLFADALTRLAHEQLEQPQKKEGGLDERRVFEKSPF